MKIRLGVTIYGPEAGRGTMPFPIVSSVLTLLGLSLDASGAFLLALPDLPRFTSFTDPEEEIDRIDQAREQLFTANELHPEDDGFDEVVTVFRNQLPIAGPVIAIKAPATNAYDTGGTVEVRYETDGDSEYATPGENPSRTLVNHWFERYIRRREDETQSKFFSWGVRLLLIGFLFQIVSVVL